MEIHWKSLREIAPTASLKRSSELFAFVFITAALARRWHWKFKLFSRFVGFLHFHDVHLDAFFGRADCQWLEVAKLEGGSDGSRPGLKVEVSFTNYLKFKGELKTRSFWNNFTLFLSFTGNNIKHSLQTASGHGFSLQRKIGKVDLRLGAWITASIEICKANKLKI